MFVLFLFIIKSSILDQLKIISNADRYSFVSNYVPKIYKILITDHFYSSEITKLEKVQRKVQQKEILFLKYIRHKNNRENVQLRRSEIFVQRFLTNKMVLGDYTKLQRDERRVDEAIRKINTKIKKNNQKMERLFMKIFYRFLLIDEFLLQKLIKILKSHVLEIKTVQNDANDCVCDMFKEFDDF